MTDEKFLDQLEEKAAKGQQSCYADEISCNDCPYLSEKTKHLDCMDHLWYDVIYLVDHKR